MQSPRNDVLHNNGKEVSWFEKLSFGSEVLPEVEPFYSSKNIVQKTSDYVESSVSSVGNNMQKFCGNFLRELFPMVEELHGNNEESSASASSEDKNPKSVSNFSTEMGSVLSKEKEVSTGKFSCHPRPRKGNGTRFHSEKKPKKVLNAVRLHKNGEPKLESKLEPVNKEEAQPVIADYGVKLQRCSDIVSQNLPQNHSFCQEMEPFDQLGNLFDQSSSTSFGDSSILNSNEEVTTFDVNKDAGNMSSCVAEVGESITLTGQPSVVAKRTEGDEVEKFFFDVKKEEILLTDIKSKHSEDNFWKENFKSLERDVQTLSSQQCKNLKSKDVNGGEEDGGNHMPYLEDSHGVIGDHFKLKEIPSTLNMEISTASMKSSLLKGKSEVCFTGKENHNDGQNDSEEEEEEEDIPEITDELILNQGIGAQNSSSYAFNSGLPSVLADDVDQAAVWYFVPQGSGATKTDSNSDWEWEFV